MACRTAGRSSHADGKALLRSCCLVVELDVEAAPEHLLFRGVRKRIKSAQPLLRSKIKNGAGQSQFPKETVEAAPEHLLFRGVRK